MSPKPKIFPLFLNSFVYLKLLKELLIKNKNLYNYLNENFSDYRLNNYFLDIPLMLVVHHLCLLSILSLIWNVECRG